MDNDGRSKRKKSLDASLDLISDLPREIIDGIMEHLPLRDAARMSVLSHKWRDIWLSTPQLVFDAPFFSHFSLTERDATLKFCSIVSKLLFQHHGTIVKFSLHVPPMKDYPDVNQWLSFLSRNGIKDFSLRNHHPSNLMLSSQLFSFVELEKLNIQGCLLGASSFSHLRKLISLELCCVKFRKGTFEHLIAGCPILEKLSLIDCWGSDFEHVTIDSPNLRHLVVNGQVLQVKNAKSLLSMSASVTLWEPTISIRHKTSLRNLIDILANSTKLEKLCLGSHFCMLLFKECRVCTAFEHLRILELSSISSFDWDDFYSVVRTLQIFPNIARLVISVNWDANEGVQILDYNPEIALEYLRWAEVVIFGASNMELKLIELLLACSPILETLSLSFITHVDKCVELKLLKQLIRFRRASPKLEIIGPLNPMSYHDSSESCSDFDSSFVSSESSSDADNSSYSSSSGLD